MSLITDFELAWKPFEDKIKSYIAKNTLDNEVTELGDLISFYKRSIRMWEDPSRVQCGFLSKWKDSAPALESDFMSALNGFEFKESENTNKPSSAIFIGGTFIVSIIGGIVGYILPKSSFLKLHLGNIFSIIIGAVVFSAVGGGIIKALYDNAVEEACKESARQYDEQIEMLHDELLTLCRQYL